MRCAFDDVQREILGFPESTVDSGNHFLEITPSCSCHMFCTALRLRFAERNRERFYHTGFHLLVRENAADNTEKAV